MIEIQKKYHFYAAHRNETINDKCRNIHGHTYYVTCFFAFPDPGKETGVTMLFSDIDKVVEPIIKHYDHCLLLNSTDKLLKYLNLYMQDTNQILKIVRLDKTTSAENIAKELFMNIRSALPITEIHLQETTSSTVIYKP